MKIEGNGYTIESEDGKDSGKPQRMMQPINVTFRVLTHDEAIARPVGDYICIHCLHVIDKSDTTCTHCGEGQ